MFTESYSRWFGIERRPWRAGGKVGSREKARARIAITCSRSPFAQIVRLTDGRRSPSRSAPSAFNWRLSCCSAARTADLEQLRVREQNLGGTVWRPVYVADTGAVVVVLGMLTSRFLRSTNSPRCLRTCWFSSSRAFSG